MKGVWFALVFSLAAAGAVATSDQPWMDHALPIPQRVQLLMDKMTLQERARQTYAVHNLPEFKGAFKADLGKTSFGSLKLSGVQTDKASEQISLRNELQAFIINTSRLSIPVSWHNEVLLSAAPQATNFPLPVTLGATFNESLLEKVHEVIAAETRATGADVGYAPEVNMYIDPRFGRLQEGFSEDPFLTSRLGVAAVKGLQGDDGSGPGTPLPGTRVAALAKHYLAYGMAAGGQNVGQSEISERTLREIYLAPWRAMVKAGLRGLMPSHQTIFDVPVHGNAWVGQVLLRQELNWTLGLSVSDCSDIGALISWGLAVDSKHAAALGLEASVDMDNMCGTNADGTYTYEHIEEAVAAGLTTEKRVNESASRVRILHCTQTLLCSYSYSTALILCRYWLRSSPRACLKIQ
jgi:beta-glucosidase